MFLSIQYPITDLRAVFNETNKLAKPNWPNPDVPSELRHFGTVGERRKGGILQWTAEERFCLSKNAINIKELTQQVLSLDDKKLRFEGRFRRFFKPGDFTCKYELGLTHETDYYVNDASNEAIGSGVYDKLLARTLNSFFNLDIKIEKVAKKASQVKENKDQKFVKQYTELKLFQAGDKLAELFLKGSTKKNFLKGTKNWWIKAGEPLALLTYHNRGKLKLPEDAILVDEIKEYGIVIHSLMYPVTKNRFIRCWLIGLDPGKKTRESISFLRQLRINLFRINAEKETMRHVLNTIKDKNFLPEDAIVTKFISPFLENVTANLLKKVRYGVEQDKILYHALRSEDIARPGSMETLLAQLKPFVSTYALKNVEKLLTPDQKLVKIFIASAAEVTAEWEKSILVITKVNKSHKHLFLEAVRWEYDMVYSNYPDNINIQDAIDPKLKESDLVVFIFYSRIGKYTRQEFELANQEKKRFFAFFKKGFTPDDKTQQGYDDLNEFKNSLNDTVLYREFANMNELESFLSDNLHLYLSESFPPPAFISPRLL